MWLLAIMHELERPTGVRPQVRLSAPLRTSQPACAPGASPPAFDRTCIVTVNTTPLPPHGARCYVPRTRCRRRLRNHHQTEFPHACLHVFIFVSQRLQVSPRALSGAEQRLDMVEAVLAAAHAINYPAA